MFRATVDHITTTPEPVREDCLEYLKREISTYSGNPPDPEDEYEMGYRAALEAVLFEVYGLRPAFTVEFHKIAA